jgi:transposase
MAQREPKRQLDSRSIGALPVVNHFIRKLNLEAIFLQFLPKQRGRGRRPKVPPVQTLLVLLRNLIIDRLALYRIPEWARGHVPDLFELTEEDLRSFDDERFARALDLLYEADRRGLVTRVIREAVRAFKVKLRQIHNDTTSVSFFGKYEGQDFLGTLLLCRGFNKDHRPDLKQLVFSVCASADEDIPVHFRLFDGNKNDDKIHCEIWDDLRAFIGHSDFIYVADSKLCTRPNMHHIDSQQGKFITVLPRTRKEDGQFRDWVQENQILWNEEKKLPNPRNRKEPPHIFKIFESPTRSSEGYRIIWVWDSLKAAHDALSRKESIDDAHKDRPGPVTRYVRGSEEKITLSWIENTGYIRWEAKTDGLFPLITNMEKDGTTSFSKSRKTKSQEGEEEFSPLRILEIYKYQPNVEKLHSMLKSVIRAMPVWLKKVRRIEALFSLIFIALLVSTLIQRRLRLQMQRHEIESLPMYPDEKECEKPTARIILELYQSQRRHQLLVSNRLQQTFWDGLSPLQSKVLSLLGVDPKPYGHRRTQSQK